MDQDEKILKALENITSFPVRQETIIEEAEDMDADKKTLDLLKSLPNNRFYTSPADILAEAHNSKHYEIRW